MTETTRTREIIRSKQFKRDFKRYLKSGIDFRLDFEVIIGLIVNFRNFPSKYKDHQLADSKDFKNCRELHIKPDLLLVYRLSETSVELLQLGSHSDLFE